MSEQIHSTGPDYSEDSVNYCPDCETPNQFGELCPRCQRERDLENTGSWVDYETDAERNR